MSNAQRANDIIVQVLDVFQRYGIKSVSMDDLARHVGMSKKTLYQHFTDKNQLVEETLNHLAEADFCSMKNIAEQSLNAIDEMFALYRHASATVRKHNPVLDFDLQRYYPLIYKKLRERSRKQMHQIILNNLIKGKAERLYRSNLNENIIAKLFVLRMENLMHTDLVSAEELFSEAFFIETYRYHLFGILSEAGLQFIKNSYPEFLTSNNS
ncbi:MAG TPA: helix-turn-helix domain-containing protein [Bacteroidales bacterium]|nr:helix-turn-helix domain-containing protein [Bacteroidales bacterium]